jgi:signal transduction histidine kinase
MLARPASPSPMATVKPSRIRLVGQMVLVAGLFFIVARIGLLLGNGSVRAIWAPAGIALAAPLVCGMRIWPGIFLGVCLAGLGTSLDAVMVLAIAAGGTVEGLLGAWLVHRFASGCDFFQRPKDVVRFAVLAGLISPLICPPLGFLPTNFSGFAFWKHGSFTLLTWWVGETVSVLVLAPLIVVWTVTPWQRWTWKQVAELGLLLCGVITVGGVTFGKTVSPSLQNSFFPYLCLPFGIWAGLRFGPREVVLVTIVQCGVMVWGVWHRQGSINPLALDTAMLEGQVFMAIFSVIGLLHAALVKERRRAEEALSQVLSRLADVEETERRRMSRELHDEMGQDLAALKLVTQVLIQDSQVPAVAKQNLEQLNQIADRLLISTHRLAWELRPAALDELGLEPALRRYTDEWSARSNIQLTFESIGLSAIRFPLRIETTMYRVAQEALTNVARHAAASRVQIDLKHQQGILSLVIADDGRGFARKDPVRSAVAEGKLGLLGMRERVVLSGGELTIESAPKAGTRVTVRLPAAAFTTLWPQDASSPSPPLV